VETPQERYDRIERWVGAYRTLIKGGLSDTVHSAGVLQYLDDDDLAPSLTVDDVDHLLGMASVVQHLRARLANAAETLGHNAAKARDDAWLVGKAQGVRLALSYLDEYLREG
jgi:hypothetical protein